MPPSSQNSPAFPAPPETPPPPGEAPEFPRPLRVSGWLPALIAAALGLALLPFSEPVARAVAAGLDKLPLGNLFDALKQFSVGLTFTSICLAVWGLDPRRRSAVVVFLIAFGAATAANHVVKFAAGRVRPHYAVLMTDKNEQWLQKYVSKHPDAGVGVARRDQWLGPSLRRPDYSGRFDSFPSGHTYAAFQLAAFLCVLYPRMAWLWLFWAFGCGLSRVAGHVHYLEDVLVGGALGWFITLWVFSWRWAARVGGGIARRLG